MSCRSGTSCPCGVWHRVDGSPGTVVALLHSGVESPYTVACPLHVTSRSASYCRCPSMSMFCMHLMLTIRRVWLVLYAFNALPASRAWCHDEPDVRRLGNARALLREAESHGARGNVRALLHREVGLEP
jgi:hypothetical protein